MRSRPWFAYLLGATCLLAALSPSSVAARAKPRLTLVRRLWGTGEVLYFDGKRGRVLERFPEPQSVHESAISPSGRLALVWHRAKGPLVLSIYDLRTRQRIARFRPGYGGELRFTPGDLLVHHWGCGTNCASFAVYDARGRTKLGGVVSGLEVSADASLLATFPSLPASDEAVVVYDLRRGRKVAVQKVAAERVEALEFRGNSVKLELTNVENRKRTLTLKLAP